jgi:exoribonuclease R
LNLFKNKNAKLKNTSSSAFYSPIMQYHQAFDFEHYTHFTSPIWRYADIIVQRQIKAYLNNNLYEKYSYFDIFNICDYINTKVYVYKNIRNELVLSYRNAEQNINPSLRNLEIGEILNI